MTERPLKILVAHLSSENGGNVELPLLYSAVRAAGNVVVESFSVERLLREHWDVVHINWPEWCIRRDRGPMVGMLDAARLLVGLRAAKFRGTKIVWTLNNLRPHEPDAVVDQFLSVFAHVVDLVICTSQSLLDEFIREYPAIRGAESRVIRPGSYRGVYPDDEVSTAQARQRLGLPADARILLSIGMVRRYKNIIPLVRSFREMADETGDAFLLVAGEALDQRLARQVRAVCQESVSTRLDLGYIDDGDIQYYLRAADATVVSTSLVVNSGSAMLALSYDCPVVAPHQGTFIEMRELLGGEWVRTFEGGIRAGVLRTAFAHRRPENRPALEKHYDWSTAGREHLDAYVELVEAESS